VNRRSRLLTWALVGLIVLVVFAAVTLSDPDARSSGPPLDPNSTSQSGSRAAAVLLDDLGVQVHAGDLPRPGEVGTLVILADDLDDDGWSAVRRFVERGGDLVVAEPFAPLAANVTDTVRRPSRLTGPCEIAEMSAVREIVAPVVRTFEGVGCLSVDGSPVAVAGRIGEGRVLSLGTAHPWRNDAIAEGDNAAFVVAAGRWGTAPVRILQRGQVGTGSESLADLVPDWVWAALAQLGVAFVAYVLWRAIRLGQPVSEADQVTHRASVLVGAEAAMTARSGDDHHALSEVVRCWKAELGAAAGVAVGDGASDARAAVERLALAPGDVELVVRSLEDPGADAIARGRLISEARRALRGAGREEDGADSDQDEVHA